MSDFEWNGTTIDDPKGRVDLRPSNGTCQEVCCDCGLGHLFKSDATWASWERIDFEDVQGIPKDRKFKIRHELESLKKENAELKSKLEQFPGTIKIMENNIQLADEIVRLKSKLDEAVRALDNIDTVTSRGSREFANLLTAVSHMDEIELIEFARKEDVLASLVNKFARNALSKIRTTEVEKIYKQSGKIIG